MVNWTKYGVPLNTKDVEVELAQLLKFDDVRHIPWSIEDCGEGVERLLAEQKTRAVVAQYDKNEQEEHKAKEQIDRMQKLMRILGCLYRIVTNKQIEESSAELARFLYNQMKKK